MNYIDDSIGLLRKMIATPSFSFEEERVCRLISESLSDWGIKHRVLKNNILAFSQEYDPNLPTLVLDAHIDTVQPAGTYTKDPFDSGNDDDTIFGLGANDDGGSVVSMIAAFRYLYGRHLYINLALSLTSEEERSGADGARWLFSEEGPFGEKQPEWVILGEPTNMRAATSERGLLVLDGEATGVSGHAARNEGVSALYIALDDITALRNHRFARVSPLMGKVKLNVTQINAGTAHNVIPDKCTFVVDIRPTEQYSNEEILAELQALCRSRLTPRNMKNRSSATRSGSVLLKIAGEMGIETFSSPTTSNWMRVHSDAIKMGPGDSARSHHADEFILRSEIEDGVTKYVEFIETLSKIKAIGY